MTHSGSQIAFENTYNRFLPPVWCKKLLCSFMTVELGKELVQRLRYQPAFKNISYERYLNILVCFSSSYIINFVKIDIFKP